ncbi:MAG: flagellar biosynthesis protein FlhB [Spirochaetota bacterium]
MKTCGFAQIGVMPLDRAASAPMVVSLLRWREGVSCSRKKHSQFAIEERRGKQRTAAYYDPFRDDVFRYDLSLFAADDEGRTEQPSDRKRRRAREEEGRVVNSIEINQTLSLGAGVAAIVLLLPYCITQVREYTVKTLSGIGKADAVITTQNYQSLFMDMGMVTFKVLGPLLIVPLIIGLLSNLAQTRFLFTSKNIKFDLKRIAFSWSNFKQRVFFSKQNIMNLAKIAFKIVVITVFTVMTITSHYRELIATLKISPAQSALLLGQISLDLMIKVLVFLAVISVIDYIFQQRQYIDSLKMTKAEVKEEMKELEGDPAVKGRIREMMHKLAFRNMYKSIPEADVIITNPTHFACALKYEAAAMQAPQLVAKGADAVALRIRQIAEENGVSIIENRELARHLYYNVEINEYIPEQLYNVVSLILAKVYRMRDERASVRMAG